MTAQQVLYRKILVERNIPFKTSDETILYTDIYRPDADGQYPALIIRLPYDKSVAQSYTEPHPLWIARNGYVVITQDTRGRFLSGGEFYPMKYEAKDGYETIQWAAQLPYCDGKVGTYGFSYSGMNQLLTAALQPPALKAMAPAFTGSDLYENWHYTGGAFNLAFNASWSVYLAIETAAKKGLRELSARLAKANREFPERFWTLPVSEIFSSKEFTQIAPYYYDWLAHPSRDSYWKSISVQEQYSQIKTPSLHLGGWYDSFIEGTLRNYMQLKAVGVAPQRLVVGPWYHMPWSTLVGQVDFGGEAKNTLAEYQIAWFNYCLKGIKSDLMDLPPVRLFVMGENRWRDETDWPLPKAKVTKFFLHSHGRANSVSGDGWLSQAFPDDELPDVFVYDPNDPIPSAGGRSCCSPASTPMGVQDQRPIEIRNDVLIYTTEPLEHDVEVTGPISAVLWASSSGKDCDFTVKLVDVFPDGRSINLTDGIIRARYRENLEQASLIEPDRIYRYEIHVGATSNRFFAGHRIRIHVSSCSFPLYDRNPNSGGLISTSDGSDFQVATQTILHEPNYPSYISLPLIQR